VSLDRTSSLVPENNSLSSTAQAMCSPPRDNIHPPSQRRRAGQVSFTKLLLQVFAKGLEIEQVGRLAEMQPVPEYVTLRRPRGNCRNCGAAPTGAARCEYCGTLW
jgi:hypothetical protein